jgi:uncharacterized coiled-coil protein SlyX
MSEVKRFHSEISGQQCVYASDYDALAAQRDEGLAREAQKNLVIDGLSLENQTLQQRLAKARAVLDYLMERFKAEVCVCDHCGEETPLTDSDSAEYLREFLASPGCADGEQPS